MVGVEVGVRVRVRVVRVRVRVRVMARHLGELGQLGCGIIVVVYEGAVRAQRVRCGAAPRGVGGEGSGQGARRPREERGLGRVVRGGEHLVRVRVRVKG